MKSKSKEFYYLVRNSVSEIDSVLLLNSNQVFKKSHNLYITRAKPKGYKADMKNPIFSKGINSWFARVLIEMAAGDDPSKSYLKISYSNTLFYNLTLGKIYLYVILLFIGILTFIRFNTIDKEFAVAILGVILFFMVFLTLYYFITSWGKEEQQHEIRKLVFDLLNSNNISAKRIKNM